MSAEFFGAVGAVSLIEMGLVGAMMQYDTVRDDILTCAQKLT